MVKSIASTAGGGGGGGEYSGNAGGGGGGGDIVATPDKTLVAWYISNWEFNVISVSVITK